MVRTSVLLDPDYLRVPLSWPLPRNRLRPSQALAIEQASPGHCVSCKRQSPCRSLRWRVGAVPVESLDRLAHRGQEINIVLKIRGRTLDVSDQEGRAGPPGEIADDGYVNPIATPERAEPQVQVSLRVERSRAQQTEGVAREPDRVEPGVPLETVKLTSAESNAVFPGVRGLPSGPAPMLGIELIADATRNSEATRSIGGSSPRLPWVI